MFLYGTGSITTKARRKKGGKIVDFNKYQILATRTANRDQEVKYRLANWSLGLAGEAGESADLIKKYVFHGHMLDRDKIKKELGDVLWYIAQLAKDLDVNLSEIAELNIKKLEKRYGDGFSIEKSVNRKE